MATVAHRISEKYRTNDVLISENISFDGLLLSDKVLNGLKNAGFMKPSPIQLKAIPLGRCGLDLIVQAKSGTGKTCVFSVIALESISIDTASTQVLVLAPTREIAVQIWEVIKSIGSAMKGLECHTFIGGLPLNEDRMKLKKCHIAVGSPGRIKQLIETGVLKAENIRMFVLDEADKLLEEGFQDQINWIYSTLPDNKQMLALSATYPEYLADHLTAYMRNPTFLRLNISDPALLGIRQYYQSVTYHPLSHIVFEEKCKVLIHILSSVSFQQCLVFSNIQTRASNLADTLTNKGWPTACIAGCLDQKDRNHAMARLKTYKCRILISTDLTARGIDADKVNLVINMDIPKDHETYLHRIGRAGRFGSFGIAISLVSDGQEQMNMNAIEKRCNTIIHPLPDPLPTDLAKAESPVYLSDMVTSEVINTDNKGGSVLPQSHDLGQNSNKSVDVYVNGTCDTEAPEGNASITGKLADEEIKDIQSTKGDDCEDIKPVLNGTSTAEVAAAHNKKTDTISIYGLCESITNSLNMASKSLTVDRRQDTEVKIDFKHKTCDGSISQEVKEGKYNLQLPITNSIPASDTEFEQGKIRLVTNSMDEIEDSSCKENKKAPVIESKKLQSPQKRVVTESGKNSDEHVLSGCASIDLSKMFKQTIGYKRQNSGLTYSSAKKTLKEFRERCSNYTEKYDFSLPLCASNNRDQELLKVAVSQLQDLFDKNIKVKLELLGEEIKADKEDFTHDKTEEVTRTADPISQGALSTCTPPLEEVKDWKPDIVDCKHGNESNDLVQKANDRKLSKMDGSLPTGINKEAVPARNKPKKHYTGKFAIAHLLQAGSSLYENNQLNSKETHSQENEETFEKPGKTEHNLVLDKMKIQSNYSDTQKNILPDKCSMGSLANGSTKPKVKTRNQNIKAAYENSRERISPYQAHKVSSNIIEDLTSDSDSDSTSSSDSIEMSDEHITQSEYIKPNRSIPTKENTYQWLNQGQWPYLGSVPAHQTSPWVNHYGNQASSQQFQSAYCYPPHTYYDPLWSSHWLYGHFPRDKSTEYMNHHMNVTMERCFNEQKDYIKAMSKSVPGGERSKPKKKEKKKKK